MTTRVGIVLSVCTFGIGLAGAIGLGAQGATTSPDATCAALVGEMRQLRVALEDSSKNQTQIQALAVYLSAEQSRMVQLANRLDAARAEVPVATERAREMAAALAHAQSEIATMTEVTVRQEMEAGLPPLKRKADEAAAAELAARNREIEFRAALQTEEARWTDLIQRLEALVRK